MLLALLFLPALAAVAVVIWRWRHQPERVLAEAAAAPATISGTADPLAALDGLLAELEDATVRIDASDELDEAAVVELELLADRLEATAAALERVG